MENKENIRKEIIRRLTGQDSSLRKTNSAIIQKKLFSSEEFRIAKIVMTYVSLPSEVDTYSIIETALKRGKKVAVPYIKPNSHTIIASELTTIENLEKGPLGIYQPKGAIAREITLKEIDLVIVPGIAFDKKNMRLGRGKGYYDRFLASKDLSSAKTIGLAFRFQVVGELPSGPHDKSVYKLITD